MSWLTKFTAYKCLEHRVSAIHCLRRWCESFVGFTAALSSRLGRRVARVGLLCLLHAMLSQKLSATLNEYGGQGFTERFPAIAAFSCMIGLIVLLHAPCCAGSDVVYKAFTKLARIEAWHLGCRLLLVTHSTRFVRGQRAVESVPYRVEKLFLRSFRQSMFEREVCFLLLPECFLDF